MTLIKRATLLLLTLCLSVPLLAMELEEAKNQLETVKTKGLVGEKPNGYLGVVSPGNDAAEIVETINEARRQEYQRIAEKHDIAVSKVEAVAGKKALEKTPAGQYIQVDGKWVQK